MLKQAVWNEEAQHGHARYLRKRKTESSAQITPVEVMSAVSRHKRESKILPRTAQAIRKLLNRHGLREYQVIPIV